MRKLLTFLIALGAIVFAVVSPAWRTRVAGRSAVKAAPAAIRGSRARRHIKAPAISPSTARRRTSKSFGLARALSTTPMRTHPLRCAISCRVLLELRRERPSGPCGLPQRVLSISAPIFPGSVTPIAACAAIPGGCNVSNAYGQTGGVGNAVQATNSSQPALVFSGLNGLPVMQCTAATCLLTAGSAFTLAQPFVMSAVYIRNPTSTATGQIVGGGTCTTSLDPSDLSTASRFACVASGGGTFLSATDVVWHGGIALFDGASTSIISVDGSNSGSQNCGTGGFSAEGIRLFRGAGGANQMDGSIAEAMIVGSTAANADLTNLFNNQNGLNGYNGNLP